MLTDSRANSQCGNKTNSSDDYRRPMSWFKSSDDAVIGRFKLDGLSTYDLKQILNTVTKPPRRMTIVVR